MPQGMVLEYRLYAQQLATLNNGIPEGVKKDAR